MTLWQLQAFVTVAKEGSFTQAGKVLHIAQPSVSALVIGLQKELGVKLFEKLGIKAHLTEAGARLLQLVKGPLAAIEKIPDEMDQLKSLKKGRIRVGGSALAAASFLPVAVQKFKRAHPGIEVSLRIERTDVLEKELLEGNLDLAVLGWRPGSPHLLAHPYREEKVVAFAAPTHPLAKKRSVALELLGAEPLIVQEKGNVLRDMVETKFTEKGIPFRPALEVNVQVGGRDAVKQVVADKLGIGFLSKCHISQEVRAGRLKALKVPQLNLKRMMYITIHKKREDSSLVRQMSDFLKRYKR